MCKGVGSEAEETELPSTDAAHALIPCATIAAALTLHVAQVWICLWVGFGSFCGLQHLVFSGM